jgi:acyl-CoA synthetase (AMP-forming)/AMP-acid ligase II
VVFGQGRRPSSDELAAFCKSRLAPYKLPKQYVAIDALPRNANGKVLKTSLRALQTA